MGDFKKQIDEDLKDYAEKYPNMEHINKPEWAFNFWVLDKLFSVDEELIESRIIDYNDKAIDCFVWHEDTLDLYLIQNKYYIENSTVSLEYINNDFLTRGIGALEKGTYSRCKELQDIYSHYSKEPEFHVYFYMYVTNNSSKKDDIIDAIAKYNQENALNGREAKFFSLDDIEQTYFEDETLSEKKTFQYQISTIASKAILSIDNEAYDTKMVVDAKYVLTPILTLYEMYLEAHNIGYKLFAENIREYLGTMGTVNKRIKATLHDPEDRKNFFFYNNGITMIVDKMGKEETINGKSGFEVFNPQVVNGCQTVSTIWDTLSGLPKNSLNQAFENVYVMTKILEIPQSDDEKYVNLYNDIVKYNNSQNSINEKAFVANKNIFKRLQTEFGKKGFLICLKQSDKYKYKNQYASPRELKDKNINFLKRFGIENLKETKDFIIDLEKLLQVFLAFKNVPTDAIQHKARLLKPDSTQYEMVINFIQDSNMTTNAQIDLYLLYFKAEALRNNNEETCINPFYIIYCFAKYECHEDEGKVEELLSTNEKINDILDTYESVLTRYFLRWKRKNGDNKGYNDMIKSQTDQELLDEIVEEVRAEKNLKLGK